MAETIYSVTGSTASNTPIIVYSDLNGLNYISQSEEIVLNIAAIANHIMNLFLTRIGECDFEPTFGSPLRDMLFDLPTDFMKFRINGFIMKTFSEWEPDVILNVGSTIIDQNLDEAGISLGIAVTVRNLNVSNVQINIEVTI